MGWKIDIVLLSELASKLNELEERKIYYFDILNSPHLAGKMVVIYYENK